MGLEWIPEADLRKPNRTRKVGFIVLKGTSVECVHDVSIPFNECFLSGSYVSGVTVEVYVFWL